MQPYGKCQNVSGKRSSDETFEVKRLGEVNLMKMKAGSYE
jgi:hypothetical protein